MHTLSPPSVFDQLPILRQQIKRVGPLSVVILLHIGLFYALLSGLSQHATEKTPNEVFATFIAPETMQAELPKPPAPAPKTIPVVQKAVAPTIVQPVVNITPSPQAITEPQPPTTPAEPAAIAAPSTASSTPAPATPALPKTITSGIEYIQAPQPDYPTISKRMGEAGKVMLRVLVNEKGRAEHADIQKSSGSTRLDEAARQALMRAIFKPHLEDGKAVAVYAIAVITFNLDS
jgi:protein TonB